MISYYTYIYISIVNLVTRNCNQAYGALTLHFIIEIVHGR